jgi:hypothetical protein
MSRRGAPPSTFQSRFTAVALVVGGHLFLLAVLTVRGEHGRTGAVDERMSLVFIDLPEPPPRATPAAEPSRPARPTRAAVPAISPLTDSAASESSAISPGIDWYADGRDAAQRAAVEPTTRDFGFPKREPAPREKKEFAWDKTHTERVHALDGGGIGIHLSDNCELILTPLPMAGCALGRRKARGDLFDEMKAPVQPGDWKDH